MAPGRSGGELLDSDRPIRVDPAPTPISTFPGSAFKVVTAAAVLESEVIDRTPIDVPPMAEYFPPLVSSRPIRNSGGRPAAGTLAEMLASSCNTGFAYLAAEQVGPSGLDRHCGVVRFQHRCATRHRRCVASVFPTDYGEELRDPDDEVPAGIYEGSAVLAQAALGQNNVSASPLTMGLVAAAVANGGEIPTPTSSGRSGTQRVRRSARIEPGPWWTAVSPETAIELGEDMKRAVTQGTARGLVISGLEIGAKTGTAQVAEGFGSSHAWVIGFAGDPGFPA